MVFLAFATFKELSSFEVFEYSVLMPFLQEILHSSLFWRYEPNIPSQAFGEGLREGLFFTLHFSGVTNRTSRPMPMGREQGRGIPTRGEACVPSRIFLDNSLSTSRGRLYVCPLYAGRDKPYPYKYTGQ